MGHEAAERDRNAAIRRRDGEIEIGTDIPIEIQLAPFDELHDRDTLEQLLDRGDVHQRAIRRHRPAGFDIGAAIPSGGQHLAILDNHDYGARKS